jgi:hypothetical protein
MFYASFHRLVFPIVVFTVIGTVLVAAWSQELQDEAAQRIWPALPLPNREHQPASEGNPTGGNPSSKTESLQQVLLENNQVVSVR